MGGEGLESTEFYPIFFSFNHGLPEFLADTQNAATLKKFLRERIDLQRAEGMQFVA